MKDFKGTPGPWEIMDDEGELKIVQSGSIEYGQGWKIYSDICGEVSCQDNAKLIAAAPELLEALRQLRDYVEDVCAVSSSDCDKEHPLMLATAAINKALGE